MITGKKAPEPTKPVGQPMDMFAFAMKTRGVREEIEAEMRRQGVPFNDDPDLPPLSERIFKD